MRRNLLASTAAITITLHASHALAQTSAATGGPAAATGNSASNSNQVEEIVVTAQKRAENIQNVPLSIQAVTGQTLVDKGISDPVALAKLVPTLQVNNEFFASGVIIRIRGFGSAPNSATDSDVASYLDGVFIPRPGAIISSFLDVSSVEVLSGPQGTLFGRNAAMGAISINSNTPSTKAQTLSVSAEGGNYGTYAGTAVANLPVNDDLALRLAIKGSHTDGEFRNVLDGRDYGENTGYVGRASAKWNVTSDLTWTVSLDGAKSDGDGAFPLTVDTHSASSSQLAALTGFITHFGGTPLIYSSTPSYTFNQAFNNPFNRDRQYGLTSDASWAFSPSLSFRLIDSYRDWTNRELSPDIVGTSLNLLQVDVSTTSRSQSHELQLISSKDAFLGHRLSFTSGLYYFHENYTIDTSFDLGSQFCTVLYGAFAPFLVPSCNGAPQTNAGVQNFGQSADSYAGYVQTDIKVLPNVELDLGARETYDKKTASLQSIVPNPLGSGVFIGSEGPLPLTFSDSKPSFRASLSWHLTDSIMAFGTFSTGYKSGGFNNATYTTSGIPATPALDSASRTFASETVQDYELGLKSVVWNGKFLLNATLFDTMLNNFQDRSFNGVAFVIRNSGNVRSRGIDVDGQIRPTHHLSFTYAATYLDSIYTKDPNAPGLEGCVGGPGGCPTVLNLSGKSLDFAPKWQGNVGVELKSSPMMGGYIAGTAATENFTTSFLTTNNDNPQSREPGYETTDLRFSIYSPDSRWQLDVFGTNVLDKHYYVATVAQVLGGPIGVNNTVTGATLYRGFLGEPAKYGVRLSAKF